MAREWRGGANPLVNYSAALGELDSLYKVSYTARQNKSHVQSLFIAPFISPYIQPYRQHSVFTRLYIGQYIELEWAIYKGQYTER